MIDSTDAPSRARQFLCEGDTVLSGVRVYLRNVALIASDGPDVASTAFSVLRPDDELDPRYLFRWVGSDSFIARLISLQRGNSPPAVLDADVRDQAIPLPESIDSQRRIVARIDEFFAEIEEGERALAEARAGMATYRKALLRAAVTGELTADWRLQNDIALPGEDLRREIVDARRLKGHIFSKADVGDVAFDVPSSWCWSNLGELFAIAVGATPNRSDKSLWNGTIPWVSSGEVAFSRIQDTREKISEYWVAPDRIHPIGTVMLGMIGEGRTRGQAAILDVAAAHNQNCASIRVSETPVPPEYVYWWLEYQYEKTRTESAGGNQPALNKARVGAIRLPLPPIAELTEIVARLTRLLEEASETYAMTDDVAPLPSSLKQSILAAAFRGELAR